MWDWLTGLVSAECSSHHDVIVQLSVLHRDYFLVLCKIFSSCGRTQTSGAVNIM